jgi:AcrR family transcriptional regulator
MDRACKIFAEKGFHNASIRDVAAATGTSPAGLYYYFRSKDELLHLILEGCLSSLLTRVRSEAAGIRDPGTRLKAIVRTHLDHYSRNRKEMRVLVHEWEALSGPFGEDIRTLMREYAEVVSETLRALHPDRSPEELRAATFGLFGMLTWVDQWHRPGRDLPLDLLADQFSAIFLGGFTGRGGEAARQPESNGNDTSQEWTEKNSTPSILSGPGF